MTARVRLAARSLLTAHCLLLTAFCLLLPSSAFAQGRMYNGTKPLYSPREETGPNGLPSALKDVGIEQRLNEQVPLDLVFRDEAGREVRLREYFGQRPVILALVYYECPMLCNEILNALTGSIKQLSFNTGREFDVLAVSFDPREKPEMARAKKETYLRRYNRPGTENGWHFLTGNDESIEALTRAVGFKYSFDEKSNQFAHASAIMVLTPEGKLSRYFYGSNEYAPKDLRLGLVEASENKIGSRVDQLLLYCFHYDPATGRYGPVVMNIIRLGGVLTMLGIGALLLVLFLRRSAAGAGSEGTASGGVA